MIIAMNFTVLFKNTQTLKFKSRLHNYAFCCHQSLLWSQATNLETQKHTKRIEIHQSQITNHCLLNPLTKLLFPKRSAKMIDDSEKCKHQLAFELQSTVTHWYLFGQNGIWFPLFPNVNYSWSCQIRVWKLSWNLPSPRACILATYMYQDEQDHVTQNA